jgi:hypothetical protein
MKFLVARNCYRLILCCLLVLTPGVTFSQIKPAPSSKAIDAAPELSRAEALSDLEVFAKRLREEAAYLELHRAKPFDAIESLKKRLPATIWVAEFTRELQKIISPIGDCHSSISSAALDDEPGLWLPFRLAIAQGGVIAITRDNSSFVEPDHPYLKAIDGQPLKIWLDAAMKYEPVGSPTQNLYRSVKGIRRLDVLRRDLGIPGRRDVTLTFTDARGQTQEATMTCRDRSISLAKVQLGESRRIGDVGYLRLPEMNDKLIPEVKRRMKEIFATPRD